MSYLKQPSIQGELPSAAKKYGLQLCNMFVCWVMSCLKQLLCGPDVQKLGNVVAIVIRVGNPEIMQKKKQQKTSGKKLPDASRKPGPFCEKSRVPNMAMLSKSISRARACSPVVWKCLKQITMAAAVVSVRWWVLCCWIVCSRHMCQLT